MKSSPFYTKRQAPDRATREADTFDSAYYTEENYVYEEWYKDQAAEIVPRIFDQLHPKKSAVFLDVGCALGGIVEELRTKGFESYGVDLSRWCIQKSPVKKFLRFGSATALPCKDQSVDIVICIDMFQYLTKAEMKTALKEFRRVARQAVCFECITKEDEEYSNPKENPDAARKNRSLLTAKEFLSLFQEAGFRLKKRSFLPRTIKGDPYDHEFSFNAIFEVR